MGQKYIVVEPDWNGMRRWVLALYMTDPEKALSIAAEMGCEAPEFPARSAASKCAGCGERRQRAQRRLRGREGT